MGKCRNNVGCRRGAIKKDLGIELGNLVPWDRVSSPENMLKVYKQYIGVVFDSLLLASSSRTSYPAELRSFKPIG